jgi:NAD(P)-dependent dehydrogenase (short-subunit alcohol dehydrogenase family)
MFNLTGKRALVTGSTQGIGYEIAKVLRTHGAEVYIHCSKDEAKAQAVAAEIGSGLWVTGDLGDSECVKRIYEKTGELDIVVANASVQFRTPWNEIPVEEVDRQINVNLRSTLELMQSYIPAMQAKKWGRFLAVGSVQQYRPHMHMAVYAASKCAIQSLVHNVAK